MNKRFPMMPKLAHVLPLAFMLFALFASINQAIAAPALTMLGDGLFEEKGKSRIWQMQRSKKMDSPGEVQQYLHQLNQGPYHDWRLPTKWELYGLFAKFDLKINGEVSIRLEGSYWIKDEDGSIHPVSWETGDQCGPERIMYPTKSGYVRAIRP
jgi:hypothetical protein